ncbi:polysaccharide pyruvyl transferase WcaK-like protein [Epilithonimonas hungarica]|uniref:polysaccharide pyruvyl transferase family protein n=1 Tax=Epilithonimonas hungarica TaxID=454006 RepID=UPI002782DF29|nr:polysaccharide pyruvyl transferase family protein [Epilithonimonas hungarica]MDP9956831.1 polysaccharide pyruvyl transferase WcaK-like protein [Epilithonimonas hungarica]
MKNKIFFLPASQIDNTGDVLINKVLLDELRKHGELIINDQGKPDWFLEEIGGKESEKLSFHTNSKFYDHLRAQMKELKNEYRFFLVIHPGHTSRKGYRSALYGDHGLLFTRFLRKLKNGDCQILRFGFSIGPFDWYNTIAEFFYTTAYKMYAVRDTESFSLGKKFRFRNIKQMPDLAWSYKNLSNSNISIEAIEESYIVLSFRSNKFGTKHDSDYLKPIIEHLKKILPVNKKIKIVYQVKFDREPALEIHKELSKTSNNIELIDEKLDLQTASNLYKDADYIISNRLHVLLLGMVQQTLAFPLIIPGDNAKIINIYRDNSLNHYLLSSLDDSSENVIKINKIISDENTCKVELKKTIDKNDKAIVDIISNTFL